MKQVCLLFISCSLAVHVLAQPGYRQRIEDSLIGWQTTYSFKGKQYKPLTVEGQIFSAYQQSLRDSFITWMQRTYKPIGGVGTVFEKDYTTVQRRGPIPQGIGADFLVWDVAFDNTGKKLEKISETWNPVYIYTNSLGGTNPIVFFNSPSGYFFTMLKNNIGNTDTDPEITTRMKEYGLYKNEKLSPYLLYYTGSHMNVILTTYQQLPIVPLTIGEVLDECEKGIVREVEERKKEARHMSSNNPSYYAGVIKDLDEKLYPGCLKNLNIMKEKYKNRRSEQAMLYNPQGPGLSDFSNTSSTPTIFAEDWYQKPPGYPIYRFTKEALENSKKDKPLWVSVTWQPAKTGNDNPKKVNLHNAVLKYFNFAYLYNYFYDPGKIKGIAYTPDNAAEQAAALKAKKDYWKANEKALPAGVHFADDFSANTDGSKPAGWFCSGNRQQAQVVTIKNYPGKWALLGHQNELSPSTSLKKPLPQNFTLEFDVATDEFNVRSGGAVRLSLSSYPLTAEGHPVSNSKGTIIDLSLEAGSEADYNNNNYRGNAQPGINSTVSGYEGRFYTSYSLREFTNKKTSIHVALKVNNGELSFFVNNKLLSGSRDFKKDYCNDCVSKGIPPNTSFNHLSFTNTTQNWSPDGKSNPVNVYISNIKITKD